MRWHEANKAEQTATQSKLLAGWQPIDHTLSEVDVNWTPPFPHPDECVLYTPLEDTVEMLLHVPSQKLRDGTTSEPPRRELRATIRARQL